MRHSFVIPFATAFLLLAFPSVADAASGIYVANETTNTVSVINAETNQIVLTIRGLGTSPNGIAIYGTGAFVVNASSNNVSVIDMTTNKVEATITVGGFPGEIAIHGTGAYVTNRSDDTVSLIDVTTNTVERTISVGDGPYGIAISGTGAFVANSSATTVSVIDITTNTVDATLTVGTTPSGVAISGTGVYVTNYGSDNVSLIDRTTNTVERTITVSDGPRMLAIAGTGAYIPHSNTSTVVVLDLTTNTVDATLTVGSGPFSAATSGTGVYIAVRNSSTVVLIDWTTNTIERTIASTGNTPRDLAVASGLDLDEPTVSSLSPVDGATDVAIDANLVIEFSRDIDTTGTGNIRIYKASDDSLVATIAATSSAVTGSGTDTITINPASNLDNGTEYYVQIASNTFPGENGVYFDGILDETTWSFTTVAAAASSSSAAQQSGGGGVREVTREMKQQAAEQRFGGVYGTASSRSSTSSSASSTYFKDVPASAWFYSHVEKLRLKGVVSGYKDAKGNETHMYGPSDSVNYGQLAKMIAVLTKHEPADMTAQTHWSNPYVREARANGLSVYANAQLNPDAPATRGAVVRTILQAYGISLDASPQSSFVDLASSHQYAKDILTAASLGIISGDSGGKTVRPDAPVNRAEIAKILSEVSLRFQPAKKSSSSVPSASSSSAQSSSESMKAAAKDVRTVQTAILNVRSDARINSTLLWVARQGMEMEVLEIIANDWAHIRVSDGNEGYVWVHHLSQ